MRFLAKKCENIAKSRQKMIPENGIEFFVACIITQDKKSKTKKKIKKKLEDFYEIFFQYVLEFIGISPYQRCPNI